MSTTDIGLIIIGAGGAALAIINACRTWVNRPRKPSPQTLPPEGCGIKQISDTVLVSKHYIACRSGKKWNIFDGYVAAFVHREGSSFISSAADKLGCIALLVAFERFRCEDTQ